MKARYPKGFTIGLSFWVIQDGNYKDFAVGTEFESGVVPSWEPELRKQAGERKYIRHLGEDRYAVGGRVAFSEHDSESCVDALSLEAGITFNFEIETSYDRGIPISWRPEVGDYVEGEALLVLPAPGQPISAFVYDGRMPPAQCRWRVRRIDVYSEHHPRRTSITRTEAMRRTGRGNLNVHDGKLRWLPDPNDIHRDATYLLECDLLGAASD